MHQSPAQGSLVTRDGRFTGVKVFTATMFQERGLLGEKVTSWIAEHPENAVTEIVVTQSSDSQYHCVTISVFYRDAAEEKPAAEPTTRRRAAAS
jgi:hypothetical protein